MAKRSRRDEGRARAARVTLRKVADEAGVSPMTVSNFVNGKFAFMSAETRARVARAVDDLDYRPDNRARGLRTASHHSVGIIIVDESPHYLSDGSTTQIVSGLGNALNAEGYTLQIEGLRGAQLDGSSLLRHIRTDGLCVLLSGKPAARRAMLDRILRAEQPVVLLHEVARRPQDDLCCISQDDRKGATQLADLLLSGGARRILLATMSLNLWQAVAERERAVLRQVKAHGGAARLDHVACGSGGLADAMPAIEGALAQYGPPDAIMGMSDHIAIAALKVLRARGLAVPGDVRVTGFNAFEAWQYAEPTLTTVRTPGYELGQTAGTAMIERLKSGRFPQKAIKLATELLIGETT